MTSALAILQRARVMPVVTINQVEQAKPLADALEQGGIDVLEVTLRTNAGLAALGYDAVKVFPAESVGGLGFLQALASVLPNLAVCPTGGVNADNLADYARLANVVCVGGSWMVPQSTIRQGNFQKINKLADQSLNVFQEAKGLA